MRETLCKFMHIYAKKNVYLYNIMINRKIWGIFGVSSTLCANVLSFYFMFSLFFSCFDVLGSNRNRNEKSAFFGVFAVICPFLSQIKRLFSVIYAYIGQTTPHTPTFGTRRVGQLSSENFLFFYFLFFCKIL